MCVVHPAAVWDAPNTKHQLTTGASMSISARLCLLKNSVWDAECCVCVCVSGVIVTLLMATTTDNASNAASEASASTQGQRVLVPPSQLLIITHGFPQTLHKLMSLLYVQISTYNFYNNCYNQSKFSNCHLLTEIVKDYNYDDAHTETANITKG